MPTKEKKITYGPAHFLPDFISRRTQDSAIAAFRAETPAYEAFLKELKDCPGCKKGSKHETSSWRGSRVKLIKMCNAHFDAYNHYRETGHIRAPMGEYDLI